jgi:uncharacterized protein YbbC (DUF1343 family)
VPLVSWMVAVSLLAQPIPVVRTIAAPEGSGPVRPGIDVFLEHLPADLRGRRVGLITNSSAIDRAGVSAIDRIAQHGDLRLVALLAPEHGIRGQAEAGATVGDERDAKTGVPVYSLYQAEGRGPTPAMLQDVDVLVYDLQEVGGRTWTYVSTMALSMQAAAKRGIPFVVLDRPNPIGGEIVEGARLDPAFTSFVGIGADLIVVKAANWRRPQWRDDTGLPWVNPSPNLRSLAALISYPGTVYFEGTNLTEGRGTDRPFEQIGAGWLRAPEIVDAMNAQRLPGVTFEAVTMPVAKTAAKFPGETIPGIRVVVTDREAYRPVRTALLLIDTIKRRQPAQFAWGPSIDRLTGSDKVRRAIDEGRLPALLEDWDRDAAEFVRIRESFLLYR